MLGLSEGWRCWEVGVGGPSIPRWLSDRVGPARRVIATDIDVRWVQEPIADNVDVIENDVVTDDALGDGTLDVATPPLISAWGRKA